MGSELPLPTGRGISKNWMRGDCIPLPPLCIHPRPQDEGILQEDFIKYRDGESDHKPPKEVFVSAHRDKIIRWADKMKDRIISSRLAYNWKNKSTLECVTERNEISKAIVLSRIRCKGGIDLDTLDKVTQWGFNKKFPLRDAAKVLKITQEAFSFLDAGNLIRSNQNPISYL